jgi:transcription antitermination protein NusB
VYAWLVGGAEVTLIAANLAEDEHFKRADADWFRHAALRRAEGGRPLSSRITPCSTARSPSSPRSSAPSC